MLRYPTPKKHLPKKMGQFRNFFKVSSGTFFCRTEDDIYGDEYDNEPRGGLDQRGTVDLVDESYIPFLSSLWQMPEIASEFAGPGSGLFKTFIRGLMNHLSKHTVANEHSTMMIVFVAFREK